MKEGSYVANHLNEFNTLFCMMVSINLKMDDKDKEITLFCSPMDKWDNFVIATWILGSRTLKLDDVVATLLGEELS